MNKRLVLGLLALAALPAIAAAREAEIALMKNWRTMDQMDDHH